MKRRTNLKVETVQTDMGEIEIYLTPENTFTAQVGTEHIFSTSAQEIKQDIYKRVKSLLRVDFRPVIEIQGTTRRDYSGSYALEDVIRTAFYIHSNRYYLGVRSNDNGKTHKLCRVDWSGLMGPGENASPQKIASVTRDHIPLSWAARSFLGIDRIDDEEKSVEIFKNLPAVYVQPQNLDFELLLDYTPEFWEFLGKAHTTVMDLFDKILGIVSIPSKIKQIEEGSRILEFQNSED